MIGGEIIIATILHGKGISLYDVSQSPNRVIVVKIYNPDTYGNLGNSSQLGLRFSRKMMFWHII